MIHNLSILLCRSFCSLTKKKTLKHSTDMLNRVAEAPKNVKKSIRVAIIGKPNTGKSTLINAMMGMNICATSVRPQTTLECQNVFNVKDDTEMVLLDTPGILSQSQIQKYDLPKKTDVFKMDRLKTVDLVGVLIDASDNYSKYLIPSKVKYMMVKFPATTEMVLILNKVDLVKDKFILLKMIDKMSTDLRLEKNTDLSSRIFTRIFMVSALKSDGVKDLVEYIRSVAHEKDNCKSSGRLSGHPDYKIVVQRIRASILQRFKGPSPYLCSFEVEYMSENVLGKLNIIVVIKCPNSNFYKILSGQSILESITLECEKDLTEVFSKQVFLRLQTAFKPKTKN